MKRITITALFACSAVFLAPAVSYPASFINDRVISQLINGVTRVIDSTIRDTGQTVREFNRNASRTEQIRIQEVEETKQYYVREVGRNKNTAYRERGQTDREFIRHPNQRVHGSHKASYGDSKMDVTSEYMVIGIAGNSMRARKIPEFGEFNEYEPESYRPRPQSFRKKCKPQFGSWGYNPFQNCD